VDTLYTNKQFLTTPFFKKKYLHQEVKKGKLINHVLLVGMGARGLSGLRHHAKPQGGGSTRAKNKKKETRGLRTSPYKF